LPQAEEILMSLRSKLIYSALFAASAAAAPAAWAQVQEPAPPAQEYPSPAAEAPPVSETPESSAAASTPITDQKIEQFADAYVAVQTIQEQAATRLQTAKEPAQADEVKAKAESDMIAAVEKSGLKVDEFNQIVETMTANADVRERVAAKLASGCLLYDDPQSNCTESIEIEPPSIPSTGKLTLSPGSCAPNTYNSGR
jgi:hypothetical protein